MSIYNDVDFVEVKNNNKKSSYIKYNHMNTTELMFNVETNRSNNKLFLELHIYILTNIER